MKVIASIEDPVVIQNILAHLKQKGETQDTVGLPDARGPPQATLFDSGNYQSIETGTLSEKAGKDDSRLPV